MSDNPQKRSQASDQVDEKATERSALNPAVAEKSQTDAHGKAEIEKERTNKHDGSAGGQGPSITIEAIKEDGSKKEVSRTSGGTEKDLLPDVSESKDSKHNNQRKREEILTSATIGALAEDNPVASAGKSMLDATKDSKVRESIKRDLTDVIRNTPQGHVEAQDENFTGGTFKIPDAAQQESRLAEAGRNLLQAEIEMTSSAGKQDESAFPIEQAVWKVFNPQGSEFSDGEIKLFRTAVTEAAGLFVDTVQGDIESFIEENKAKVALALAGAAINTGVAIETSKDGVTAAGLPAAAAGIITILKYLASQLKPSTGLPDSSSDTLPEKTPPDNIDTRVPTESRFKPAHEIYEDFQKAIEKLVKDPVEALEEFSLKADAFKAVKSNIVFNPESHHVPEHVLKLVEQMESSNPVDLVTTAENTKFVFPDSIDSLAEYKNLPQEVIDGALMYRTDPRFGAASAGLTIPTTNNECYIIVPATRLQVISGKSIENGDVAAHLRHEMGHVLRSKLGWEENVQVRSRIYDGQRLLEKDLESVYQKIDSGQPLTDTENALSRLQNLTYNMRASLAEGQKLAQRQTGAEEVLCELYSIEYSPHPMNDAFTQQVLKYFGDALEPLRENNWNRPKDPTRVRRLFGVLDR